MSLSAGCLIVAGCGGGGGGGSSDIGQAGQKTKATRVIQVRQSDKSSFEPAYIVVGTSETVTLRITNTGTRVHEFFLGNKNAQEKHKDEIKADRPNSVTVDPGATKELTWAFPKSGKVLFGCHEPGDYGKGMKGEIEISE